MKTAHIKKHDGNLAPAGIQPKAGLYVAAWVGICSGLCIRHLPSKVSLENILFPYQCS